MTNIPSAPLPESDDRLHRDGQRIEELLDEIRAMGGAPTYQRVEELVQRMIRLYGAGLERLIDLAREAASGAADEMTRRMCDDELVAGLLLLHGLHPRSPRERIDEALAGLRQRLRTDIELIDIDDTGVVRLRGTSQKLRAAAGAVERAIMDAAPEVTGIVLDDPPEAESELIQIDLSRSRANSGGTR